MKAKDQEVESLTKKHNADQEKLKLDHSSVV